MATGDYIGLLDHDDILELKKTYEDIYTMLSPFARSQMGWNYSESTSKSKKDIDEYRINKNETNPKSTSKLWLIVVIAAAVVLAGGVTAYWFIMKKKKV